MVERLGKPFSEVHMEKRIRDIEKAVSSTTLTARENDIDVEEDGVPQVSGLSLNPGNGRGIAIRWSDANVPQSHLDFYEIQFASNTGFTTDVHNFKTKDLQFTFSEGTTGTVYYARVRVVLNSGDTGDYSVTLNTTSGQAVTDDVTDNAVTTPTTTFTAGSIAIASGATVTVQSATITKDGSDIYVMASVVLYHTGGVGTQNMTFRLMRGTTELAELTPLARAGVANATQATYFVPDTSGLTGSYTYTIEIQNPGPNGEEVTERSLALVELKR